jgi:hypothetical protein
MLEVCHGMLAENPVPGRMEVVNCRFNGYVKN